MIKTILIAIAFLAVGILPAQQEEFTSKQTLLLGVERLSRSDYREAIPLLEFAAAGNSPAAVARAWLGHAYHLQRRLDEAGAQYRRLLAIEPLRQPTAAQRQAILRYAPRAFQVRGDPFDLRDAVAIHHPEEPLIAYHFFWEDDIDFPEDNDPCDHEVMWVRYNPATNQPVDVVTYFHGRMLRSASSVSDAARNSGRPRVNVQWGKHGSMPFGWETLRIAPDEGDVEKDFLDVRSTISVKDYNAATYRKLNTEGRRLQTHPLSRNWPVKFAGTWESFVAFDKPVDVAAMLSARGTMAVSRWNNAAIQQNFLAYNFRPKTEWPDRPDSSDIETQLDRRIGATLDRVTDPQEWIALRQRVAPNPDPFLLQLANPTPAVVRDLPPMDLFRPETPRYPNVWFNASAEQFDRYEDFVDSIKKHLVEAGYRPDEVSLNEGADVALSIEHLQPWGSTSLGHAHAIHIRLFWKKLQRQGLERSDKNWRVAASVHYEVEHAHPLHADVEVCPICGRTGGYAAMTGNLVERVHDPIGVELLLFGQVRGMQVLPRYRYDNATVFRPQRPDMNTEAVALVQISRPRP